MLKGYAGKILEVDLSKQKTKETVLDETILRLVPALFGTALLVVFLFFAGGLSREAILAATRELLTLVIRPSPARVQPRQAT